jgi:hypothetical protein
MINNREWEEQSANHLLQFLKHAQAEEWRIIGRDVLVDPLTRENFDFQLALGDRRIALELFRLVESEPELADRVAWDGFTNLLRNEMERRNLKDYSVGVPCALKASPEAQLKKVKDLVDGLETELTEGTEIIEREIDHVTFRRVDGLGYPHFWRADFGLYDGVEAAKRILERILPKKNKQVSMPCHEGVLLIVHWLGLVNSEQLAEACARVDFKRLPAIARIYFEDASGAVTLSFDRFAGQEADCGRARKRPTRARMPAFGRSEGADANDAAIAVRQPAVRKEVGRVRHSENPLFVAMPETGDELFRPLDRRQGGIIVHPGGITDAEGDRDTTIRCYLYEEGYKRAADLLVRAAQSETAPDRLLYPIVFLYRQYFELKLKSLLNCAPREDSSGSNKKPGHDLVQLWERVERLLIPEVWPEAKSKHVKAVAKCVQEFQRQDQGADAFRYPEDKSGSNQNLKNLESVDLCNLSEVTGKIANFLDCADEALGRWMEYLSDVGGGSDY